MKISVPSPTRERGSVLIASLMIAAVIGVTLASYLVMTQAQNAAVARSQTWNTAITLTEAGVEDALALLNKYSGHFDQLTNWSRSDSIAQDNWTAVAPNVYFVRRYLGDGFYEVYVTNQNNRPVISSRGTVKWHYAQGIPPSSMFATVANDSPSGPKLLTRAVNVRTKVDPLFNVAMAALREINFNGNNVETDSFDSADPLYSDNGQYPTNHPERQKDNGDVVTDFTIINALNVGNAQIKGQAKTGPRGTIYVGPNGSVGTKAWVEGGKKGIEPGRSADDMNVLFPAVTLPQTTWLPAQRVNVWIGGSPYDYVILSDGDYVVPGFSDGIYVASNVTARIRITGNVSLTSNRDAIRVAPGASMKLYMEGSTFKVAGKGVVNDGGNAANFYYFGLPSNTSVQFNGNGSFTGVIYAPNAEFSLGGGGTDVYDFVGSSVTRTVRMNGKFRFHYDENLRRIGLGRGYIPTNWKEM